MADNSRKTPLVQSLDAFGQRKAFDAVSKTGRALPCEVVSVEGSIVTVKFDVTSGFTLPNTRMAVGSSEFVRLPVRQGTKGVAFPATASLGAITGLGGTTSNLAQPGNLQALVFVPVGNTSFFSVDGNYLVLYGPNGVTLRDEVNDVNFTLSATGIVVAMPDSASITIGNVTITNNDVIANGKSLTSHLHGGVTAGGADTGPPV
jgi:hypothetical protein